MGHSIGVAKKHYNKTVENVKVKFDTYMKKENKKVEEEYKKVRFAKAGYEFPNFKVQQERDYLCIHPDLSKGGMSNL